MFTLERGAKGPGQLFCQLLAATAAATLIVAASASAQTPGKWSVRAEAGIASIHDNGDGGPTWGLAANRRMGASGLAFWELGLYAGGTVGFLLINPGVQLRLLPRSVVTPVFAAHLGYLSEAEWSGIAPSGTAGLLAVAGRLSLMVSGSVGTHGGERGPHSIRIGIGINSREQQAMTIP